MTKTLRLPVLNDYLFGVVEEMFPEIEVRGTEFSKLICKGMDHLQAAKLDEVVNKRFPQIIMDGEVASETRLEGYIVDGDMILEVVTIMYITED